MDRLVDNIAGVIRDWNDGGMGDVDALIYISELLDQAGIDVGTVIPYDDI